MLAELKAAIVNNEFIFERRAYYETLYRDSLQPNYTSLATSTDSNYMPPPAVPPMIQSPPSILSTASGPASQPLNPMSNPTPTPTSLFSAPNTNQVSRLETIQCLFFVFSYHHRLSPLATT